MQERRPDWYSLDRPAYIEEDLVPLAVLHEILRKVGLARLRNGVLRPGRGGRGRPGGRPSSAHLVREPEGVGDILGGVAVAVLAVFPVALPSAELTRRVVPLIGHRLGG